MASCWTPELIQSTTEVLLHDTDGLLLFDVDNFMLTGLRPARTTEWE